MGCKGKKNQNPLNNAEVLSGGGSGKEINGALRSSDASEREGGKACKALFTSCMLLTVPPAPLLVLPLDVLPCFAVLSQTHVASTRSHRGV